MISPCFDVSNSDNRARETQYNNELLDFKVSSSNPSVYYYFVLVSKYYKSLFEQLRRYTKIINTYLHLKVSTSLGLDP